MQNFAEFIIEDVFVYIEKIIEPKEEGLRIKFHKVLGIKYLSIQGVKLGL